MKQEYDKMEFEIMIENWMTDNEDEICDLKIGDAYFDEDLGWTADAEDEKSTYCLTDDGTRNIKLDYIGAK